MKKVYSPMSEKYYYLYSEEAVIKTNGSYNTSFKWNIPNINIQDSELSVVSIVSSGSSSSTKYIIRTNLGTENVYDSLYRDPILYISTGLNTDNIIDSPKIQIKNRLLDSITLQFADSFASANVNNGIDDNISFVICLKIVDYIPDDKHLFYTPNPKQIYDQPNYL